MKPCASQDGCQHNICLLPGWIRCSCSQCTRIFDQVHIARGCRWRLRSKSHSWSNLTCTCLRNTKVTILREPFQFFDALLITIDEKFDALLKFDVKNVYWWHFLYVLYRKSDIYGNGFWTIFRNVTLPLIMNLEQIVYSTLNTTT